MHRLIIKGNLIIKVLYIIISSLIYFSSFGQENVNQNIFEAIKSCDSLKVKALIENGANINATDSGGTSPLMWAASKCDIAMVKLLIKSRL